DDSVIRRMYEEGKTTADIARYFNVSPSAIRQRYKAVGIDVSNRRRPATYAVNERFFDEWSREMAYVLGFILTDGCVTRNTLIIAQAEIEPLEAIRNLMSSNYPIKVEKNGRSTIYVMRMHRKSLIDALALRGI